MKYLVGIIAGGLLAISTTAMANNYISGELQPDGTMGPIINVPAQNTDVRGINGGAIGVTGGIGAGAKRWIRDGEPYYVESGYEQLPSGKWVLVYDKKQ